MTHLAAHTVAAYLDGGLPERELDRVEKHLVDCGECRAELREVRGIVSPRTRSRARYFTLAGLAVAAAAAFVLVPRDAAIDGRVRSLGDVVQPPIYLGVPVREPARGTDLFAQGMNRYAVGDYAAAADSLRAARAAGVDGAALPFFLGASLLMLGDAVRAAGEFAIVIGKGQSPYLAEAHYYQAKTLLRAGDAAGALRELDRSMVAGEETFDPIPRSLRDSLRAIRSR